MVGEGGDKGGDDGGEACGDGVGELGSGEVAGELNGEKLPPVGEGLLGGFCFLMFLSLILGPVARPYSSSKKLDMVV